MNSEDQKTQLSGDDVVQAASVSCSSDNSTKNIHRFQPGKSGNPKGRPARSKNRKTIIRQIAAEKHTISTNEGSQSLTTLEIALLELRNHVASGNKIALRYYETLQNEFGQPVSDIKYGVLVAPAPLTIEEWLERCELENEKKRQAMLDEPNDN